MLFSDAGRDAEFIKTPSVGAGLPVSCCVPIFDDAFWNAGSDAEFINAISSGTLPLSDVEPFAEGLGVDRTLSAGGVVLGWCCERY